MSKDMDTIKLEKVIKRHSHFYDRDIIYTQIDETDKAYLYEKSYSDAPWCVSYYVILKRRTRTLEVYHEGDKVIRRYSPYREIFPDSFMVILGSDEKKWWFGFYDTIDRAYAKLREL